MTADIVKSMKDAFSMTKQRCYNKNCPDYRYYGGRGITICQRWLDSFDNFIEDMGLRPVGMTLERKDNDGPYSKENCVWATRSMQSCNTRSSKKVTWNNETKTVAQWERDLGFKAGTLKARLGPLGYSIEEAFTKPVLSGLPVKGKAYPRMVEAATRRQPPKCRPKRVFDGGMLLTVKQLAASGMSRSAIARQYGTTTTTVSNAVDGLGAYRDN